MTLQIRDEHLVAAVYAITSLVYDFIPPGTNDKLSAGDQDPMDASRNPYAPSRASLTARDVRTSARLWRQQKVLIMSRDGEELPDRCVKCNDAADEPTKTRAVYWHHPGFYVLLLVNVIVYAIVALIARKSAKISPGLCVRHKRKRLQGICLGWGGLIVGLVATFLALGNDQLVAGLLLLFATLGTIIAGVIMARIVYAKRIDDRYVQLKGCGEAFLAELPEFRPGARDF